ncbi:MAG TPA: AAA family ATPase [Propionibacteriaceae bacterium]
MPAVLDAALRRTVVTLRPPSHDASEDQFQALRAFDSFLASRDDRVFVLSGAAGTGKTTLLDQMMARVEALHRRAHLAALTGRAATVARLRAGRDASTLHAFLYRFDPRSSKVIDGVPRLVFKLRDPAEDVISVLFVDEASMLGSTTQGELETMQFGSGNLARDLLGHLFGQMERVGDTPKLVLIGDPYQLPPIADPDSVAFSVEGWDGPGTVVHLPRIGPRATAYNWVKTEGSPRGEPWPGEAQTWEADTLPAELLPLGRPG